METDVSTHIDSGIQQLSAALDAQHQNPEAVYSAINFCSAWPTARSVLQFIGNAVPIVGRIAVSVIVDIGDGVYASKGCQPPMSP